MMMAATLTQRIVESFERNAERPCLRVPGGRDWSYGELNRLAEKLAGLPPLSGFFGKWVVGGYQGDLAENKTFFGIIYGERYRGILAHRGDKVVIGSADQGA